MKITTLACAILFGTTALATPHRHLHNHAARHARHAKRDDAPPASIVTEWVSVVKTVEVTATVWITPSASEPTSDANMKDLAPAAAVPISSSLAAISEPLQTPVPENHAVKETQPNAQDAPSAPLPENNSVTPSPAQSISTPGQIAPASAPVHEAAEDVPIIAEASGSSNTTEVSEQAAGGGSCSSASPCDGDITYYEPGLGACGWTSTSAEPVVALPHEFMGTKSNGNPYCGKYITIEHNGRKSQAKVVDKCMGCKGFSIDLSNSVFSQLESLTVGRTTAKWWIN